MPSGTVLSLHRWPVKSVAGETLDALDVDERGVPGDRAHAVWLRGDRVATARTVPRLLLWSARYPGGDLLAHVTSPDGRTFRWDDDGLEPALRDDLGKDVTTVRDLGGMQDLRRSLLLTLEQTRTGLEEELGEPADLRRFRPNVHASFEGELPFAEAGWEGRRVRIGEVELEALHPCVRCAIVARDPGTAAKSPATLRRLVRHHDALFGLNLRPVGEGTIRAGDPVEVL
jgi:uncharacterized protein